MSYKNKVALEHVEGVIERILGGIKYLKDHKASVKDEERFLAIYKTIHEVLVSSTLSEK